MLDSFSERNLHWILAEQVFGMMRRGDRGLCLVVIESYLNVDLFVSQVHGYNTVGRLLFTTIKDAPNLEDVSVEKEAL